MDTDTGGDAIQARLRLALRAAMKAKDTVAVPALRSVLAAIGNAEALHQAEAVSRQDGDAPAASQHVAGGTVGLAAAETARRKLTLEETATVVREEMSDRQAASRQYEAAGHPERADRLRREAQAIQSALDVAYQP